jgi:hypothetical protein
MNDEDLPPSPRSPALREALRRLGNPYASLQVVEVPEFRALTAEERAYVRRLENQYAPLSIAIAEEQTSASVTSLQTDSSTRGISKADFDKGCRRIFRQYIPALEKGRLRLHHRDFITRNIGRAPGIRYVLLDKLRTYDLGDIQGFQARFNRERDPFTDAKLREIELAVSGRKK